MSSNFTAVGKMGRVSVDAYKEVDAYKKVLISDILRLNQELLSRGFSVANITEDALSTSAVRALEDMRDGLHRYGMNGRANQEYASKRSYYTKGLERLSMDGGIVIPDPSAMTLEELEETYVGMGGISYENWKEQQKAATSRGPDYRDRQFTHQFTNGHRLTRDEIRQIMSAGLPTEMKKLK